ncbi:DUF3616 domain-containing protein [Planktothrix sp. FACHB-1355]|uniref:DUF3616 domain-containing protein n=1 Tax=Aerosakkonema funiforme FACHB-1375 TaxID=2949571 RepID=A0A926VCV8_9CYAN|nr:MULTISPECIES: DUF3616 domain-containing protein [Oscillatoriales]MBD2180567.1 DUF3616 domain-containing protein [Aerosakkonema funiforme FACHB-1375]MBD3559350.1 DUF3616 domain-containing protein [Planktothrix sp. FACHB-1355]
MSVLLNELKVNPPGTDDYYEYIELKGLANEALTNLYLVAIDGDLGDRGKAKYVLSLGSQTLGSNGFAIVQNGGYTVPAATRVITDTRLSGSGALENGSNSFLLINSSISINQSTDYDINDDGILELPTGATIVDAVGWSDGDSGDLVYGGVSLTQSSGTPDAATRFQTNNTANSAAAWYNGDLSGTTANSLTYDLATVSANFPTGGALSPGNLSFPNLAPTISVIAPLSGVIGDSTNPGVSFTVSDAETNASALTVTATSNNGTVVSNGNITVTAGTGGNRTLNLNPLGVGYADITVTVSDGSATTQTILKYAASAGGGGNTRFHTGASDASTAIALDSNIMLVADDEDQKLRLYDRNNSGLPINQFDFTSSLGLTDISGGVPREVDIEGSTRVGNRIFWIGSHSNSGTGGSLRPNRNRIFATDISGSGTSTTLSYVGRYDNLRTDLINWDSNNIHGKGANYYGLAASAAVGKIPEASDSSGFNIEGLAMAPGSTTTAYVSFRAPIEPTSVRTNALIVPVTNFDTLAMSSGAAGSATFGAPIELDLGGRGIRSIEGNGNGFLIVAGAAFSPAGEAPNDFRLYTWSGDPSDAPQMRDTNLTGMNPEGIVELPSGSINASNQIQLISDNGDNVWYNDGIAAKDLTEDNFQKFRSDWVTLGNIVASPLINEVNVNPPGTDSNYEYIELKGLAKQSLANLYLVAVSGNNGERGLAKFVKNLNSQSFGSNGLLAIQNGGYTVPTGTTVVTDTRLSGMGFLDNATNSFLLINSPTALTENTDYDSDNDGVLELPTGAKIMDAVGWSDGDSGDLVYGGVSLTQSSGTPDAATRLPTNSTPNSAAAWYNGDLSGSANSVTYSSSQVSSNFPTGGALTPGDVNVPNTSGTSSNDTLTGNSQNNVLVGRAGNDVLQGLGGNDFLDGGDGNDTLYGNQGADSLIGGAGVDKFVLAAGEGTDYIYDFVDGTDLIGLANGLTFNQLEITQDGTATRISLASNHQILGFLLGIQVSASGAADFTS